MPTKQGQFQLTTVSAWRASKHCGGGTPDCGMLDPTYIELDHWHGIEVVVSAGLCEAELAEPPGAPT